MDVMSLSNRERHNTTTSIAQDIESLIHSLYQFTNRQSDSQAYSLLADMVARELMASAEGSDSYIETQKVVQSLQNLTAYLDSVLDEMRTKLEHLEQARIRREKYSSRWWEQTFQKLLQAFDNDSEAAYRQWITIYAEALVDWELEACSQLVSMSFPYPSDKYPYALLVRHGNESLQSKDYPATLEMLNYLVSLLSEAAIEGQRLLGALLSVFIGRINLYQMKESEIARRNFDRANALAPHDGRPLAAL